MNFAACKVITYHMDVVQQPGFDCDLQPFGANLPHSPVQTSLLYYVIKAKLPKHLLLHIFFFLLEVVPSSHTWYNAKACQQSKPPWKATTSQLWTVKHITTIKTGGVSCGTFVTWTKQKLKHCSLVVWASVCLKYCHQQLLMRENVTVKLKTHLILFAACAEISEDLCSSSSLVLKSKGSLNRVLVGCLK